MTPADLAAIGSQKPTQHPRPGEGELHVQTVDLAHELEVGRRHRARQVINRAARDVLREPLSEPAPLAAQNPGVRDEA
jgi:hypothetical protein